MLETLRSLQGVWKMCIKNKTFSYSQLGTVDPYNCSCPQIFNILFFFFHFVMRDCMILAGSRDSFPLPEGVCVVGARGPSLRVCYQYCRCPRCASLPVCCNAWTLVAANRCLWGLTCGRYGTARLTLLPLSPPPLQFCSHAVTCLLPSKSLICVPRCLGYICPFCKCGYSNIQNKVQIRVYEEKS